MRFLPNRSSRHASRREFLGTATAAVAALRTLRAGAATDLPGAPLDPRTVPGLISLWDFREASGAPRQDCGAHGYALEEGNGPIQRVPDGIWSPAGARITPGQWFRIPRAKCPALNLHGPDAQYTILAWIKRMSDNRWQYIAGMWNETDAKRQYALFTSGTKKSRWRDFQREDVEHHAHAYVSTGGGGTPPARICMTYSTGATYLEQGRWYFLAATYDQQELRTYVDGKFDAWEEYNPYRYPGKPIFDGGPQGADFTVAQRAVASWRTYPEGVKEGPIGFVGLLGGLAVYGRALTGEEIHRIHAWRPKQ